MDENTKSSEEKEKPWRTEESKGKKLKEEALGIAQKIAEKSTLAVAAVKESVNRSYETTLAEGVLFERRVFHSLFATEDQKEGMNAFVEKREPQFRGK